MNADDLFAQIQTTHLIWCGICQNKESLPTRTFTRYEASLTFYNRGWRLIDGVVHCPNCVNPSNNAVAADRSAVSSEPNQ